MEKAYFAYAGIGSRETPKDVIKVIRLIAARLEKEGWILRSGGAKGADSAFEEGIKDPANMEIFLPSSFFNGKSANRTGFINSLKSPVYAEADKTVEKYHPCPEKLSEFPRKLMARNAMQIMGFEMNSPVKMVIAWTRGGKTIGGTGQALRMAFSKKIPILNLGDPAILQRSKDWLFDSPFLPETLGETPF